MESEALGISINIWRTAALVQREMHWKVDRLFRSSFQTWHRILSLASYMWTGCCVHIIINSVQLTTFSCGQEKTESVAWAERNAHRSRTVKDGLKTFCTRLGGYFCSETAINRGHMIMMLNSMATKSKKRVLLESYQSCMTSGVICVVWWNEAVSLALREESAPDFTTYWLTST